MSWSRVIFFLTCLYIAYLFNVPVPDNVNEKFKFRTGMAIVKLLSHLAKIESYFGSGVFSSVTTTRRSFSFATKYLLPSGESYAPEVTFKKKIFDGVRVNIYTPPGKIDDSLLPGFIYIRGGGLALFDADHFDGLTRRICLGLNAVVVSIDYRLTPEHVFPIPFEDSFRATKWFMQHAKEYNVDPQRVAIGGDSAGGYLSATVSQAIYDDKSSPNIKIQVLIYPWLQILDLKTPSYQKYRYDLGSGGVVPSENMALFSAMHLYGLDTTEDIVNEFIENNHTSNEFRTSSLSKERLSHSLIPPEYRDVTYYTPPADVSPASAKESEIWKRFKDVFLDPRLSPLFRKEFSGLPTAYIATMEYDTLTDDGILYAKHLEQAGVDVTWRHYDNGFHGVVWISPGLIFEDGKKIMQDIYQFLKPRL